MSHSSNITPIAKVKIQAWVLAMFFIIILILIPIKSWHEIQLVFGISALPIIIKEKSFVPPLILGMPILGVVIMMIFNRAYSIFSSKAITTSLKIMVGSFIAFLIALVIYPNIVNTYIEDKGYTICNYYSGSTLGSHDIWLRDSSLCIPEGYQVRTDLIEWIENKQMTKNLTSTEVNHKITQLKNKQSPR